jgi:hypothetical protein
MAAKSPFPGIDPFIEARGLWEDFHDNLILEIKRQLSADLPPGYVARGGSRSYVELVDPVAEENERRGLIPDVAIPRKSQAARDVAAATSFAGVALSEPMMVTALAEVEFREIFIEIWKLAPQHKLVTCIEVLSPTNKRPGTVGWNEYSQKRSVFLSGYANFVELDLLRKGKRHATQDPLPASPYYLLVMRKEEAPRCAAWPTFSTKPLEPIPIPLFPPDRDIILSLQPIIDNIFATMRYHEDMNYDQPLRLALSEEEKGRLKQGS